jgi:hypothetical protein
VCVCECVCVGRTRLYRGAVGKRGAVGVHGQAARRHWSYSARSEEAYLHKYRVARRTTLPCLPPACLWCHYRTIPSSCPYTTTIKGLPWCCCQVSLIVENKTPMHARLKDGSTVSALSFLQGGGGGCVESHPPSFFLRGEPFVTRHDISRGRDRPFKPPLSSHAEVSAEGNRFGVHAREAGWHGAQEPGIFCVRECVCRPTPESLCYYLG